MMNLSVVQATVRRSYGRGSLLVQKHSPEILLGAGLIGFVATVVMASKATLKVHEITDKMRSDLEQIDDVLEMGKNKPDDVKYDDDNANQDKAIVYVQTGMKFAKLYGPAVGVGVLSLAAILSSHGIMTRRQAQLTAAYGLLAEGFARYRRRVVDELGEDTDKMYRLGLHEETTSETVVDEEGKKSKVKKIEKVVDGSQMPSDYARFFDESSPNWQKDASMNLFFLKSQQSFANDALRARGHIFLNEVYDMLGLPRTEAGQIVGWVYDPDDKTRDSFVDFGIYNVKNQKARDFVNGYERAILLDFNVDGIVYNLLK